MYCNFLYFSKNLIFERLADSGDDLHNLASNDVISKHTWLMFCQVFKVLIFLYCDLLLRPMVGYHKWYAYHGLKNHTPVGAR